MGYDNPLHSLNGDGERVEELIEPTIEPGYDPKQAVRAMAVSMAADVLGKTSKPAAFGARPPVDAGQIIQLADYIIGNKEEDHPLRSVQDDITALAASSRTPPALLLRWGAGGPKPPMDEAALQSRADRKSEAINSILKTVGIFSETKKPADLEIGDWIAPDGDVLVEKPVYDAETDTWSALAHCPSTDEGETFAWIAPGDLRVLVYIKASQSEA